MEKFMEKVVRNKKSLSICFLLGCLFVSGSLLAKEENTSVAVNPPGQTPPGVQPSSLPVTRGPSLDSRDPLEEMDLMLQRMNRWVRKNWPESYGLTKSVFFEPDLDLTETDTYYILKADVSGMTKDQINVEVTEREVVVAGERKEEKEQTTPEGLYKKERSFGSFRRVISLPEAVKADQVLAQYEQGVLTIKLPKVVPSSLEPKKVKVDIR